MSYKNEERNFQPNPILPSVRLGIRYVIFPVRSKGGTSLSLGRRSSVRIVPTSRVLFVSLVVDYRREPFSQKKKKFFFSLPGILTVHTWFGVKGPDL